MKKIVKVFICLKVYRYIDLVGCLHKTITEVVFERLRAEFSEISI